LLNEPKNVVEIVFSFEHFQQIVLASKYVKIWSKAIL
jgi:hypothetical protein